MWTPRGEPVRRVAPEVADRRRRCRFCMSRLPRGQERGRPRRYCSNACRQADYRRARRKRRRPSTALQAEWLLKRLPKWPVPHQRGPTAEELKYLSAYDLVTIAMGWSWGWDRTRGWVAVPPGTLARDWSRERGWLVWRDLAALRLRGDDGI